MFSHLKQRQLGVGATEFTEVVGGVQQLTKPAADALNLVLANRYPALTAGAYFDGTVAPAGAGDADYWSYGAYPAEAFPVNGQAKPEMTAAAFIAANTDAVVLVDNDNVKQVLNGLPVGLVLIIGKPNDNTIKAMFAGPTSSSAVLSPRASAAGPSKKSSATPLLVAAAAGVGGALVGGPVLGAVAAVAGYYVASA